MGKAKLRYGRNQAVRMPRDFHSESDHVVIDKSGKEVLLRPAARGWDSLVHSLSQFSEDFLADRDQLIQPRPSQLS